MSDQDDPLDYDEDDDQSDRPVISFIDQATKNFKALALLREVFEQWPICREVDETPYTFDEYYKTRTRVLMGYDMVDLAEDARLVDTMHPTHHDYPDATSDAKAKPHITIKFSTSRLKSNVDYLNTLNMNVIEMMLSDYLDNQMEIEGLNIDEFDEAAVHVEPFDDDAFQELQTKHSTRTRQEMIEAVNELLLLAANERIKVRNGTEEQCRFDGTPETPSPD